MITFHVQVDTVILHNGMNKVLCKYSNCFCTGSKCMSADHWLEAYISHMYEIVES